MPHAGDDVGWTMGAEIELLAPVGRSRFDLAAAYAGRGERRVERFFHPQAEPSRAAATPVFETLTLGFRVRDEFGQTLASFVDDLTLQDDLDRQAKPKSGWYRIAGDDARLMRLIARTCDASADLDGVLTPACALFGGSLSAQHGLIRLSDGAGAPVAIAAALPGERERPCEIVTRPLVAGHRDEIGTLLHLAETLGFTAPAEGAVHLHFDASRLAGARQLRRLIRLLSEKRDALRTICQTNPRCRRLGPWPDALLAAVEDPGFAELSDGDACRTLGQSDLTKFCDFNLLNILAGLPEKNTFEVRILPAGLDADRIIALAKMFAEMLEWVCGDDPQMPSLQDPMQ